MFIHLLGRPVIAGEEGGAVRPRGRKAWGLMARVLLTDMPVSRRRLSEELFATADDPMGALRWSLAQLRRAVGDSGSFCGDPVEANLSADVLVDIKCLDQLEIDPGEPPGLLLEGVDADWSAEFDVWLSVERWRAESQVVAALRRSTMDALSVRDSALACTLTRELVARTPLDEGSHVLLVQALVLSGDMVAATERVDACVELFMRELQVEPTAALHSALREDSFNKPPGVSHAASARALLEAGNAAVDAGAVDAGIDCLRRAVMDAERSKDTQLCGRAQCALGAALIHAIRGFDDEGSVVMRRAVEAALEVGDAATAVAALRELGYVETLAGRRREAAEFSARALEAASELPEAQGLILSKSAINLADWGRTAEALETFREARELSQRFVMARDSAHAMTFGARTMLGFGLYDEAQQWLDAAIRIAIDERWNTFRPVAETFRLELDRLVGRDPLAIRADLEHVFAATCQLGDPCWEGLAVRGIGLTYQHSDDADTAYKWLEDGIARCTRVTDTWMWVEADILEREMDLAMRHGHIDRARAVGERLVHHSATKQLDLHAERAKEALASL